MNSFKSGKSYQHKIYLKLNYLFGNVDECLVEEVKGAMAGSDVCLRYEGSTIGFECKNKGAFEGGSKKMYFDNNRLKFPTNTIHQMIVGDTLVYDGLNLPWYDNKRSLTDYEKVRSIFDKDIYIAAHDSSISNYYKVIGTHYIQIEGLGLYHTGDDILDTGADLFSCEVMLRIRSSKHKRNGIPTDVTGALQYNRLSIKKSKIDLDCKLPKYLKLKNHIVLLNT